MSNDPPSDPIVRARHEAICRARLRVAKLFMLVAAALLAAIMVIVVRSLR